tara:strand:+ start:20915 stop:22393 length:1479 start_codon:yes stop_codon:yes gene_type:complete
MSDALDIKEKIVSGLMWIQFARIYEQGIRFFSGIYLARTIAPDVFGQQAYAVGIFAIMSVLVMFGQDLFIIRQNLSQKDTEIKVFLGSQISIRIGLTLLLFTILLLLWTANIIPINQDMKIFVFVLLIGQAPNYIIAIFAHYMEKLLHFKKLALINVISSSIAFFTGVYLAFQGQTIWALLSIIILRNICAAILTLILSPILVKPIINIKSIKQFFDFGKILFVSDSVGRIYSRIDQLSIGSILSNSALGFYQRALILLNIIDSLIGATITQVTVAAIGQVKQAKDATHKTLQQSIELLTRVSIALILWIGIIASELIPILYGENWSPSIVLLQLLTPYALCFSLNSLLRRTEVVSGVPKSVMIIRIIQLMLLGVLLYPMITIWNANGVAIAVDISMIVSTILLFRIIKIHINLNLKKIFFIPIVIACVSSISTLLIKFQLANLVGTLELFFIESTIYWLITIAMFYILERSLFFQIKDALLSRVLKMLNYN